MGAQLSQPTEAQLADAQGEGTAERGQVWPPRPPPSPPAAVPTAAGDVAPPLPPAPPPPPQQQSRVEKVVGKVGDKVGAVLEKATGGLLGGKK